MLPRYSPFLNPIKDFFSKVKLLYHHVEAESAVVENTVSGQMTNMTDHLQLAMARVTLKDYAGWIDHVISYFDHCLAREDHL